jgi:flagellar FliL protein
MYLAPYFVEYGILTHEDIAMSAEKQEGAVAAPAAPAAKGNTMLFVIIAVLGTLLVAGGVGTALFMSSGSKEETAAATDEEEAAAPAEAEGSKKADKSKDAKGKKDKKGGPKLPAIYTPLEPPFVVNFPAGQGPRFLQVTVEVMTREPGAAQVLKDNNPLLRNDLLLFFSGQTQEALTTLEGREEMRKKALEAVRNVVRAEGGKPEEIEAIYFTSFVMQ